MYACLDRKQEFLSENKPIQLLDLETGFKLPVLVEKEEQYIVAATAAVLVLVVAVVVVRVSVVASVVVWK
jgi:hypothetical protein